MPWGSTKERRVRRSRQGSLKEWGREQVEEEEKGGEMRRSSQGAIEEWERYRGWSRGKVCDE
jgi:hypothetical protein